MGGGGWVGVGGMEVGSTVVGGLAVAPAVPLAVEAVGDGAAQLTSDHASAAVNRAAGNLRVSGWRAAGIEAETTPPRRTLNVRIG